MPADLIKEISIYSCPIRLKEPFIISLGKLEFADNTIVTIRTSQGLTGFGECSPFLTIHGENGETAMAIGKLIAEKIIGMDAGDIASSMKRMDSFVFGNTSIKSAFDIALHDITAQKNDLPLYKFLGGNNIREIFTDYTVSIGTAEKMAEDALHIMQLGFKFIKVKLGGSEKEDFLRIKRIRETIGMEIPVRIDANQGWTIDTALSLLPRLEQFNIEHCEEPVSRHSFLSLPKIRAGTNIPIMADESCFDESDAGRLAGINACDLFNVKLGKSSGIYKAMKIVEVADRNNIGLQAGGFLESRLGFTAMAHVAMSSERFSFFDFDTPLMFTEDPVTGGMIYGGNGRITLPESAGLGASVDPAVLSGLKKATVHFS